MADGDRSPATGDRRVLDRLAQRQDHAAQRPQHPLGSANDGFQQRQSLAAGDPACSWNKGKTPWRRSITTSKRRPRCSASSEAEVKQMLERRELHGYRDGADWKFKVGRHRAAGPERAGAAAARPPPRRTRRRRAAERGRAGPIGSRAVRHGDRRGQGQGGRPKATSAWPTATSSWPTATIRPGEDEARRPPQRRRGLQGLAVRGTRPDLDQDLTLEDSIVGRSARGRREAQGRQPAAIRPST